MPINETPIIEFQNVSFRYGSNLVLENIDLKIEKGDYVGIIGPNGGGKSTLLKLMLGLLKPDTGKILVFGCDVCALNCGKAKIGYVPQHLHKLEVNFPATVEEVVKSGLTPLISWPRPFSPKEKQAIEKAMELTGTAPLRHKLIHSLSGGEHQRVMIARALASEPEILIFDEPTTGVDVTSQETFYQFLASLNHEQNLTIIFVSHDIDIVANEVHSLLLLNKKVISFGLAKNLINQKYLEELYGKKVNFTFHQH